jgi:hypothetical protein
VAKGSTSCLVSALVVASLLHILALRLLLHLNLLVRVHLLVLVCSLLHLLHWLPWGAHLVALIHVLRRYRHHILDRNNRDANWGRGHGRHGHVAFLAEDLIVDLWR